MTFKQAFSNALAVYDDLFRGRAPRSQFWWLMVPVVVMYVLVFALLIPVAVIAEGGDNPPTGLLLMLPLFMIAYVLFTLYAMVMTIPMVAMAVRRLHDTDRSGWWYWISMVPFVGIIVLIVFLAQRGTRGPNKFGPDPLSQDHGSHDHRMGDDVGPSSIPTVPRDS